MRTILKLSLAVILACISLSADAQVLISLLLGDALNTEKIEFGLAGGLNQSYILDMEESNGLNNLNIGFYFHINMFDNSYLSTGVQVKANMGAEGMSAYPIGDPDFDDVFAEAELTKKIHYFYLPILWHQRFYNRFYLEGGLQLGLRTKAYDYFHMKDAYGGDLEYRRDVRDDYAHLDGGVMAGVGYKLQKQTKSTSLGISYYYGLKNVSTVPDLTIKNSSIYFYVKVPIMGDPNAGKEKEKENKPSE